MKDLKIIIAGNITELRKRDNMTQLELAEKLNYSDKAISKWERGESVPDIVVLKNIADLFGISVDYLLCEEHEAVTEPIPQSELAAEGHAVVIDKMKRRYKKRKMHKTLMWMSIMLVWLIAVGAFIILDMLLGAKPVVFVPFVLALPVSCIVGIVLNSVWFYGNNNLWIVSCLMWTMIAAVHVSLIMFGVTSKNIALIYLLGIPGQIIIILWAVCIKRRRAASRDLQNDLHVETQV